MRMRKAAFLGLLPLFVVLGARAADGPVLKTDKDRLSYSIGASVGHNLQKEGTDVDLPLLIEGLKSAFAGKTLPLSDKEIRVIMSDYERDLRKQAAVRRAKALTENRARGEAYLTEFRKQPDVRESPGGILYQVVRAGSERRPAETDTVRVYYRGTLVDGTEFDATEAGKPAELKVSALISGWKQALTMMGVGAKWRIAIPSHLAYGERGVGSDIGPNEVLLFDVELVDIK